MKNCDFEKQYEEYLMYLYKLAANKYIGCPDIEPLIQETLLAFFNKEKTRGKYRIPKRFAGIYLKKQI